MGLPHLCLAKNNDREKRPQPRAPRPKGRFARRVPLKSNESRCSPLWRALRAIARQSGYPRFARLAFGRGARRLGCRLAFQTPCQFRFPRAEGRVREESPKSAELCVAPRRGALGRASAFLQRLPLGLPTPPSRARCIECASTVPCLSSRSAGRSPFKVCSSAVDVCFAFLTDFPRGRGRRGRLTSPKTERGAFRLSKLAEKLSRSVFCLRRASPPKLGHCPCGARRASPALVVLRGAAMPRQGP